MRVQLVHWNDDEARGCAAVLRKAGCRVARMDPTKGAYARWVDGGLDAVVIDLSRLPSHGTMVAVKLRQTRATRNVPLVFAGGAAEKVARVREALPDATFTTWDRVGDALREAVESPPARPVVPKSITGAPSTPLTKRLAIREGMTVVLRDAPAGFVDALGDLPDGVRFEPRGAGDMVLWFVRTPDALEEDIADVVDGAGASPLWIAWPRHTRGERTGLSMKLVLEVGRAMGLAESKVCAIGDAWSAAMFRPSR